MSDVIERATTYCDLNIEPAYEGGDLVGFIVREIPDDYPDTYYKALAKARDFVKVRRLRQKAY